MKATDSHRYLLLVFLTQSLGKELSNTPPEPYSRTFYPHAVKHLSVTHSIMWSFCTRELSLDDKVIYIFFKSPRDFPRGPVVKNPPCNAGDAGSIPGQGTKIPHAIELLSLHTTTRESVCHNKRCHMT